MRALRRDPVSGWWRPASWVLLVVLALVPPHPSAAVAGLLVAAGLAELLAERGSGVVVRTGLLAACGGCGAVGLLLEPGNGVAAVPIFVAGVAVARLVPRRPVVVVFAVLSTVAFALAIAWLSGSYWGLFAGLGVPLVIARSWDREMLRREHARVLGLLAELEERRDAEVRAAATAERTRIARDLHDVLAHTLSGLSLHLQAARAVVARQPEPDPTVADSLDRAADLARSGLDEARRAVAALRDDAVPGATELAALVADDPAAHLDVRGDLAALDALDPPVRETVYATVRESLTNARRYAPGAPVRVVLEALEGAVTVEVDDDGAATARVSGGQEGGGLGLRGLAERAAAVGGSVEAGAVGRGWSVRLRVPDPGTAR